MRVLIVGAADSRGALAAVRGLGRAGRHVAFASPARGHLVARSRWVRQWHPLPDPAAGTDVFADAVARLVREFGYDVVFAAGDDWLAALAQVRDRLGASFPYTATPALLRSMDKLELVELASSAGLSGPRTVAGTEQACRDWSGRAVVKPRRHFSSAVVAADVRLEAVVVPDGDQALERVREIAAAGGEPVLQEVVEGRLLALTMLTDEGGRPVARVQQVADEVWPVPAGVSTRARTVAVDPQLAAGLERLLASLSWFGLAQAQFLLGPSGPVLIDVNARFYGSMALALRAGVNLPALWADLAAGERPAGPVDARPGVAYTWLEGDLRRAAAQRRGGGLHDVGATLSHARGAAHSMASWSDPLPVAHHAATLAGRAGRKAWRRIRS